MSTRGSTSPAEPRPSPLQRYTQFFARKEPLPTGPRDYATMTEDEKRQYITRVDPMERKIGLMASALAVALALIFTLPYMVKKIHVDDPTVKPSHGKCPTKAGFVFAHTGTKAICKVVYPVGHYIPLLVLPLVLAAGILLAIRIGRRSVLAFITVMTGLALSSVILLLPFALAGGWVMLRAWRTQKYGAPNTKVLQPGWTPPPPRASTRRPKSTGPSRGSARSKGGKGAQGQANRTAPSANKRYTPRTPPKPPKKTATR